MIDFQKLNNQKRTVYRIIAPLAVVTIIVVTLLEMLYIELEAFDFLSRGLAVIAYGVVSLMLWFKQDAVPLIEKLVFIVIATFFVSQFYAMVYHLQVEGTSFLLTTLPLWLPMVYLLAHLTFEIKWALKISLLFYLILLIPGVFYIALNMDTVYSSNVANIYISNAIYIFCIYAVGKLFLHYARIEVLKEQTETENKALQEALKNVKTLSGLLPICANCKKIRDDEGYWQDVAVYIRDHSEADFSHGICPECAKALYPEYYDGM